MSDPLWMKSNYKMNLLNFNDIVFLWFRNTEIKFQVLLRWRPFRVFWNKTFCHHAVHVQYFLRMEVSESSDPPGLEKMVDCSLQVGNDLSSSVSQKQVHEWGETHIHVKWWSNPELIVMWMKQHVVVLRRDLSPILQNLYTILTKRTDWKFIRFAERQQPEMTLGSLTLQVQWSIEVYKRLIGTWIYSMGVESWQEVRRNLTSNHQLGWKTWSGPWCFIQDWDWRQST